MFYCISVYVRVSALCYVMRMYYYYTYMFNLFQVWVVIARRAVMARDQEAFARRVESVLAADLLSQVGKIVCELPPEET